MDKKYLLAYLVASLGWIIAIVYFGYEYLTYTEQFYQHVVDSFLEHFLIACAIPGGMSLGYILKLNIQSKDKTEKSEHLKSLFIDIIRHDSLNSIGLIKSASQIINEDYDFKGAEREMDIITLHAERLEQLIDMASRYAHLLDVNNIKFKTIDITPVIRESIADYKNGAQEKNITIQDNLKDPHILKADDLISEVFSNLLSNAIKYSPENTTITISAEDIDSIVRFSIMDQGSGVEDKYKNKIFQRFERGGKEGVKGTGLGLAIVRQIVELHQGRVWVEDNLGGGSIFIVELPKSRIS